MKLSSATLVYFSPTGTTRKILEAIGGALHCGSIAQVDLTPPSAENMSTVELSAQIAVIGVPVYAGRVPPVAARRLGQLRANGAPAVLVAVYGNREFEDALLELKDIATRAGFRPVACGAFIGEHSFSEAKRPIAAGRPDEQDLAAVAEFGEKIRGKILEIDSFERLTVPTVPGNFPYIEREKLTGIAPVSLEGRCTGCEKCVSFCPVAAISAGLDIETDKANCIICCACVKACPSGARVMQGGKFEQITAWLNGNFSARKQPATFL